MAGGASRYHVVRNGGGRALVNIPRLVESARCELTMSLLKHVRGLVRCQPQIGIRPEPDRRTGCECGSAERLASRRGVVANMHPYCGEIVLGPEGLFDARAVGKSPTYALRAGAHNFVDRLRRGVRR